MDQNRDQQGAATYLLTWVCYGTWVPGQGGAIPRTRNQYGSPLHEADAQQEYRSRNRMTEEQYTLDSVSRQIVLKSIQQLCPRRGWTLWAAHVRTNHVHVVATANCKPELVMNAMKAHSSRALNQYGREGPYRRRWARHGSTRYLWTVEAVRAAIQYVVNEQGTAMAVFENARPGPSLALRVL